MKTLWIVSGGAEAVPGIQHAKSLGLHVVVSDANPQAPGFEDADDSVVVSTYDPEATSLEALKYNRDKRKIDGVIAIASDVPVTVATVAHALGLPSISMETARLASNKLAMKKRFLECNIPAPWFSGLDSTEHLAKIVSERGLPLVVKPVDSRGARGVTRLADVRDLSRSYSEAVSNSPSGSVMVEEYLEGPQISTESVLIDNAAWTPGFADRNYEDLDRFLPYMIENGGQQPSRLKADEQMAISNLAVVAGRALGVRNGIVKGDMVLTNEGPKVIEIATRLSGGWFSTDQIPLSTGVDLVGSAIRIALDEPLDVGQFENMTQRGVAIRYFFSNPGFVQKIVGLEKYSRMPWVHRLGLFIKPGAYLSSVTNHTQRAGFVITSGKTSVEAVSRAQEVVQGVKIVTRKSPCL